jgi:hypothetical protein
MEQIDRADLQRRRRRNMYHDLVSQTKLEHREFVVSNDFVLSHVPSACWFNTESGEYIDPRSGSLKSAGVYRNTSADEHAKRVKRWLQDLRSYLDEYSTTPDLWAAVNADQQIILAASQDSDNTPFSPDERTQLFSALNEIRAYLAKTATHVTEGMKAHIDSQFAYLQDASERLGRKDWLNAFVGAILGVAIQSALTSNQAQDLLRFAKAMLQPVFVQVLRLAGN